MDHIDFLLCTLIHGRTLQTKDRITYRRRRRLGDLEKMSNSQNNWSRYQETTRRRCGEAAEEEEAFSGFVPRMRGMWFRCRKVLLSTLLHIDITTDEWIGLCGRSFLLRTLTAVCWPSPQRLLVHRWDSIWGWEWVTVLAGYQTGICHSPRPIACRPNALVCSTRVSSVICVAIVIVIIIMVIIIIIIARMRMSDRDVFAVIISIVEWPVVVYCCRRCRFMLRQFPIDHCRSQFTSTVFCATKKSDRLNDFDMYAYTCIYKCRPTYILCRLI